MRRSFLVCACLFFTLLLAARGEEREELEVSTSVCPPARVFPEAEGCDNSTSECQGDSDCESPLKCCSDGCKNICRRPLYTGCQQLRMLRERQARALGSERDQVFVPRCSRSGKFEDVQCNSVAGNCWCVDAQGFEVGGTRARSLDLVNCSAPSDCAGYLCRMLCPYGFALDEEGCPLCECRNPCKDVKCPGNQECQIEEVPCAEEPCPPMPTCKQPRSLDDLCPFGDPLTAPDNGNPFLCGMEPNKPQCPPNFVCNVHSGNDYGVCCPLSEKPGECPETLPQDATCGNTCESDIDCSGSTKCCKVEQCGQSCIPPANTTLCLQQKAVVELLVGENPGYVPQCTADGQFKRKQCSTNGKLCWCVDEKGVQVRGTMGPGESVHCEESEGRQHDCDLLFCDINCEYGYKIGEDGCHQCECLDPCENMNCPNETECMVMREEPCMSGDCPPVATCYKKNINICLHGEPYEDKETHQLLKCTSDECPKTHDCEILPGERTGVCCLRDPVQTVEKPGKCPTTVSESTICNGNCTSDVDCNGEQKCCMTPGCGQTCLSPASSRLPTMCEYLHDMGEKIQNSGEKFGISVPQCQLDGSYEPIQCDDEECWCVDEFGVEISKSRAKTRDKVDCRQMRASRDCLGLLCRLGCDYGFETDESGCSVCSCRNPCKGSKCGKDEVCQMVEVQCTGHWCPAVPKCVSSRSPSVCPMGSPLAYHDTETPVICDPRSEVEECPVTHVCIPSSETSGVCCPKIEITSNITVVKDGECPMTKDWEVGTCAEECALDSDCPGPQKCCKNGCGAHVCRDPKGSSGKIGQCPYLIPSVSENCDYKCSSDYSCPDDKKCCSNGCGTTCTTPVVMTGCQHQHVVAEHQAREMGMPASRVYLPQCNNDDGSFEPVQCHPVTGICWCADKQGREVLGTRQYGPAPNCTVKELSCPALDCEINCEYGLQMGVDGCPICECKDPCEGVVCKTPYEECRPVQVNCIDQDCPPVSLCQPRIENPCPYGEPLVNEDLGGVVQCGPEGRQCPSTHRCHLSPFKEYAVCCPKPRDICYQEADPGLCKSLMPRWYFNYHTNECEKFRYGGCGGNQNNFASKEDCEATCPVMSACERIRERSLKILKTSNKSVFVPKCNKKTGHWEAIQCLDSLGLCWCVTPEGDQVSGTLVRGTPTCTRRGARTFEETPICSSGESVHVCPDNICENKICLAHPNATCKVDPCGGCKPQFYNTKNQKVDCTDGLTACQGEVQDVLNSRAWDNQGIHLSNLDELVTALNDLSAMPPSYPPPPPPQEFRRRFSRSVPDYEEADSYEDMPMYMERDHMPGDYEGMRHIPPQIPAMPAASRHMAIVVAPRFTGFSISFSGNLKSLLGMGGERILASETSRVSSSKSGSCPSPSMLIMLRSFMEGCLDECSSDADCSGEKRCCMYGCATTCVTPLVEAKATAKPGECPAGGSGLLDNFCIFTKDECFVDQDCSERSKCCPTRCGNVCMEPKEPMPLVPATMVIAPPICSADGGYAVAQSQGQLSWCVNEIGEPIQSTLTRGFVRCDVNGNITHREPLGPVCPDPSVTLQVCRDECRLVQCFQHPDAVCVADPCNNCEVSFVNKDGDKVDCDARCTQPVLSGNCRSVIPRFGYNQTSRKCEQFMYGGCGGNDNNFHAVEECQKECEQPTSACEQPKEIGFCRAQIARWWYNKYTHQCEQFFYGGCGGNENNFETKESCEARCPDFVLCPWTTVKGQDLELCNRHKACENATCEGHPDAVCTADPCDCSPYFVDPVGKNIVCGTNSTEDNQHVTMETNQVPVVTESNNVVVLSETRCLGIQRQHRKDSTMSYIPQCAPDGSFLPMQCTEKAGSEECWCVDEAGMQLEGTGTFPIGHGYCEMVKVKKIDVRLAFRHNSAHYADEKKPEIHRAMKRVLRDLNAQVERDEVAIKVEPRKVYATFTLTGDNKVDVAYHLFEMVKNGVLLLVVDDNVLPAIFRYSDFHYVSSHHQPEQTGNSLAVKRVLESKLTLDSRNTIIIAVVSAIAVVLIMLLIAAVVVHKKRIKDIENSKPSLVSLAFTSPIYGFIAKKFKSEKPQEEVKEKPTIQTIEAQFENFKNETSVELPPAYEVIDEKSTKLPPE